jgi:alpha-galactosidase
MNKRITLGIALAVVAILSPGSRAVAPAPGELAEARRWVAAKLLGHVEKKVPQVGLEVLANLNAVQLNARNGKPLLIGEQPFQRGLYCHAHSKVVVRLPGPGKTFTARVGVDSNDQTRPGRGSIVFSVIVGTGKKFQSAILREAMPAVPVRVDLDGAREFVLEVSDGGDGIGCDQADWADAKVTLSDGRTIWLADMDLVDRREPALDTKPFYSFVYDGQPSAQFLGAWNLKREVKEIDSGRTKYTLTYTDPKPGLKVRCEAVAWKDFPLVEWTMYFKNQGHKDTPLLESIQALDAIFRRGPEGEFLLHHHLGDRCTIDSFAPLQTILGPKDSRRFAPAGGRPTSEAWPYYNLERPQENRGIIVAIGWPGQWAAQFSREGDQGLRVTGGQELTRFKLHPGEEIRTPLIALQFYKGDWLRGQNLWRRWLLDHNLPKDHGKPLSAKLGAASVQYYGFNCTQSGDIDFIDRFVVNGLPLDYWWMDAGWYKHGGAGWPKVGTWEVDDQRFPGGIKAVADHCHPRGIQVIVWFEVERVHPDTWITRNHPEWIHGGARGGLLKMDEPAVVRWITNHVDKLITTQGIDLYRSDFNIDPLPYWRAADARDRQGITEIRYIQGYLAYWDELQRRHPGMLIDSCASGGRRNDLETLRRAVPLLRSDFEGNPEGNQCHTYGFGLWIPYFNAVHNWSPSPYNFRSCIAPFVQRNWDVRNKEFNFNLAKKFLGQWRGAADFYFGDFYPLSTHSTAEDVLMAWQFDRPDLSAGVIQAFRRRECPYVTAQFRLRGLEPDAPYVVSDLDSDQLRQMTGRELMDKGLLITLPDRPSAALITYKKKPGFSKKPGF